MANPPNINHSMACAGQSGNYDVPCICDSDCGYTSCECIGLIPQLQSSDNTQLGYCSSKCHNHTFPCWVSDSGSSDNCHIGDHDGGNNWWTDPGFTPPPPPPPQAPYVPMHQQTGTAPRRSGGQLRRGRSLKPLKTIGKNISTPMQHDVPDCCYAGSSGYGTWRCTGIYGHGGGQATECQVSQTCSQCGQLPSNVNALCSLNDYCEPEGIDQSCSRAENWMETCIREGDAQIAHQQSVAPQRD